MEEMVQGYSSNYELGDYVTRWLEEPMAVFALKGCANCDDGKVVFLVFPKNVLKTGSIQTWKLPR